MSLGVDIGKDWSPWQFRRKKNFRKLVQLCTRSHTCLTGKNDLPLEFHFHFHLRINGTTSPHLGVRLTTKPAFVTITNSYKLRKLFFFHIDKVYARRHGFTKREKSGNQLLLNSSFDFKKINSVFCNIDYMTQKTPRIEKEYFIYRARQWHVSARVIE